MKHSILAPSGSSMWARCVGSLYLGKGLPSLDAEHNASGSCSHWLGEWALKNPTLDLDSWLGQEMTFGENPPFKFVIDEERIERVRAYVTQVNREPGMALVEQRLDTTPVLGVPGQEGHADTVKIYPEGGVVKDDRLLRGVISVHDFKDGHILVRAEKNLQLMIYLCAAMFQYDLLGDFQAFRGCIHQPRLNHYDEWTYTRDELLSFMESIRPVAQLAFDLYHGNVAFDPLQHLTAGEQQCQWCPVRGRCPARAKYIISLFDPIIAKYEVTADTLGAILKISDDVRSALRDYEEEATRRALSGTKIPGQKLVRGRRGDRRWMDPERAVEQLRMLLPDEKIFEEPKVISPAEAERLLKAAYKPLAAAVGVMQNEGRPQLDPEDSPRKEITIDQFKPVEGQ